MILKEYTTKVLKKYLKNKPAATGYGSNREIILNSKIFFPDYFTVCQGDTLRVNACFAHCKYTRVIKWSVK